MKPLDAWIEAQAKISADRMERAISATHLRHARAAFGQVAVPRKGSVLASPVSAHWDPEPDYFFHWLRDSAIVMGAVVTLGRAAENAAERARWNGHFEDFVRFSLELSQIDGADFVKKNDYRSRTQPAFAQFLRPEAELRQLKGDALLGEPRFNPDGTPDFLGWSRPQYDGAALRALCCLRYDALCREQGRAPAPELARMIRLDLDFTARHADDACIGPWEEANENGHHYYAALAQLGAMHHGRAWAQQAGDAALAENCRRAAEKLRRALDGHWSGKPGVYKALRDKPGAAEDAIDSCTVLATLDAALPGGRHSVADARAQATLAALEKMFGAEFPINRAAPKDAPALGRSRGDKYFGGGAWYPATLGAASFYYSLAAHLLKTNSRLARESANSEFRKAAKGRTPQEQARALIERGDAFMETVRKFTPADGSLSEQFDRASGAQASARHLTWSYAAFIAAAQERETALALLPPAPPAPLPPAA
jgi:glucoamylase